VEHVANQVGVDVPAVGGSAEHARDGRVGREVVHERRETPDREPAAPELREVDAVEALEIGFYGVGVLSE